MLIQAEFDALVARASKQTVNPATLSLSQLLGAYAKGDAATFNQQPCRLSTKFGRLRAIARLQPEATHHSRRRQIRNPVAAEDRFRSLLQPIQPVLLRRVLYLVAFVLGVFSWIGWTEPLRRASIWLLWFTFVLHTLALVARIYISGRPPITNLYSTAIFIGWAGVRLALLFESIYRLGLGNIVAAASASSRCSSPTSSRSTATRSSSCKPCSIRSSGSPRT